MSPEQVAALTGGGDCFLHSHPHIISLDELHRMQQLETVVFVSAHYQCRPQDDFIFVNSSSGAVTVTLSPANYGQHIVISRIAGANTVTVAAGSGETVNLVASVSITASFTPRRFKGLIKNISGAPAAGYLEI